MLQVDFRKLMQILGDKTVIATTYQNVWKLSYLMRFLWRLILKLFCKEITKIGGKAVMTGEHETGSDRIAEAVQNIDYDIVINVQVMNLS